MNSYTKLKRKYLEKNEIKVSREEKKYIIHPLQDEGRGDEHKGHMQSKSLQATTLSLWVQRM